MDPVREHPSDILDADGARSCPQGTVTVERSGSRVTSRTGRPAGFFGGEVRGSPAASATVQAGRNPGRPPTISRRRRGPDRPAAIRPNLSPYQRSKTAERDRIALKARLLLAKGLSNERIARALGVAPVTLWRILKSYEAGGKSALIPRTHRCGNRSALPLLGITLDLIQKVRLLRRAGFDTFDAWRALGMIQELPGPVKLLLARRRKPSILRSCLKGRK
jgi:hypothetical protein